MNNTVVTLAKIAALTAGALLGGLLARWVDSQMSTRFQAQSEYDKIRYAQGLSPVAQSRPTDTSHIHTVGSFTHDNERPNIESEE